VGCVRKWSGSDWMGWDGFMHCVCVCAIHEYGGGGGGRQQWVEGRVQSVSYATFTSMHFFYAAIFTSMLQRRDAHAELGNSKRARGVPRVD
jgi:hypothetical protein